MTQKDHAFIGGFTLHVYYAEAYLTELTREPVNSLVIQDTLALALNQTQALTDTLEYLLRNVAEEPRTPTRKLSSTSHPGAKSET